MTKVKNINGQPEKYVEGLDWIHSDDDYFYFFETEIERRLFLIDLPIDWSGKKQEIEDKAEKLFDEALQKEWYSRFDVILYAQKGETKAKSLLIYYDQLWTLIEDNFSRNKYDFELPIYSN